MFVNTDVKELYEQIATISPNLKAGILAEALPHIRRLQGKTIVVKYGGNAMTDEYLQQCFARDVVLLKLVGLQVIVVHGGGPQIENALSRMGKKGEFVQGMRVTDKETMVVVEAVLGGQVQGQIVGLINHAGGSAVGLSGRDANMIRVKKLMLQDTHDASVQHDIGQVGDVTHIDPSAVTALLKGGFIPVVSPIGFDEHNHAYNINADVVAGELARVLNAEKLVMLTNIKGVLNKDGELMSELNNAQIDDLIADGTLSGGMLPKIASALDAAKSGVNAVHIIDGRVPHCMLLEMLTDTGVGTMITQ
ncbi:acetylglutamate kinase [Formosimonas limnophila]|uniref:Acetylglutamate kinase n=1 Tax=Formosimonas limnophila TaxID=1384487 RepID=A0A8J3G0D1_9BURK|nr:acetylglutamate kinase [Formosimonas limnophila]GHA72379.1 acetylglutamate kinase [Formosimonas limnophila]